MIVGQEKPPLEELVHFGVQGMRWGVRNDKPRSTSSRTKAPAKKMSSVELALAADARRRRRVGAIKAGLILGLVGARITVNMLTGIELPAPEPTVIEGV